MDRGSGGGVGKASILQKLQKLQPVKVGGRRKGRGEEEGGGERKQTKD